MGAVGSGDWRVKQEVESCGCYIHLLSLIHRLYFFFLLCFAPFSCFITCIFGYTSVDFGTISNFLGQTRE